MKCLCYSSGLYYKSFNIIIYNRNDNGLYYKTTIIANLTMIIANLALAKSVNYDHKLCCKLKHTFTIVNYDIKPFIVQATDLKDADETLVLQEPS
jgi:hypothetical protein